VSGANVELFNGISFHVYGDANISGSIIIDDEFTYIYLHDDIFWWSGSQCINNSSSDYGSTIYIYDDWNFESGSNVVLDKVNVTFVPAGSSSSIIECNSATSSFYSLSMLKSATSTILLSGSSTQAMQVTYKLTIGANNNFYSYSNHDLVVNRQFDNSGHFYFANGNLILDDFDFNIQFNEGDFANNLNMTTNNGYVAIVGDALVNGDIEINGAGVDVWNTLLLGGDFDNNASGTDIDSININGDDIQNIYNLECNTLILDKPSGEMRFPSETSTCNNYDWMLGLYRVSGGTFTINDLVDNGIFGTISVTSGELNIHQDAEQYIDLNGTFYMTGGVCNIYGGTDDSWWSYGGNASVTMYDGILDFVDNGIRVYNSGTYTFAENIEGGTIRTAFDFIISHLDFEPSADATVELYGPSDCSIQQVPSSIFPDLHINKTSGKSQPDNYPRKHRIQKPNQSSKANQVMCGSDIILRGDFLLEAGTFVAPTILTVFGNWANLAGEANFVEGTGTVEFDFLPDSYINTNETFYNLDIEKWPTFASTFVSEFITLNITNNLDINNGTLHIMPNSTLIVDNNILITTSGGLYTENASSGSEPEIYIGGDWDNNNTSFDNSYGFSPGSSIVEFNGTSPQTILSNCPDGDFASLIINSTSVSPSADLHILDDFTINNGLFNAPPELYVGGNWTNLVGESAFIEGSGLVVFDGNESKYCYGEEFYNLEIDKAGSMIIFPDANYTSCESLDWTQGGYHVDEGFLLIRDLVDDGIYGDILLTGGWIIMTQGTTSGEYIDLNGSLTITDGIFDIQGGSDDSYWSYNGDASINMSGGSLNFMDVGIRIYDTPSYTFSENITEGSIWTLSNFIVERNNFTPENNLLFMWGSTDAVLSLASGSNLHDLTIAKTEEASGDANYIKYPRTKIPINGSKSNTITALSDLDINGDFKIFTGAVAATFMAPSVMNVAGNWDNREGEDAFVEGTGLVIFDGINDADILNTETFFNLIVDKTSISQEVLEIIEPEAITVINDLEIQDGTFYMNNNTTLDIDNDLTIADEARIKANNGIINIGGDWYDNNTGDVGFYADYSTVTFDGPNHQYLYCDYLYAEFNNLIINKAGSPGMDSFEPLANVRMFGDLQVMDGNWYDTPSDNNHLLFGDLFIGPDGRWTDISGIVTLSESATQSFVNDGGGYFDIIMLNKSNPTDLVNLGGNLVFDYLNINSGDVTMTDSYYLNHEGIFVEADASLTLDAGTWLVSDAGAGITVSVGGQMAMNGTDANHCVITENGGSGYYNFDVYGELSADYTELRRMSADGIYIHTDATLDAAHAFNNCQFSWGEAGGSYLTINNNQTITSNGVDFTISTNWGGSSNVRKTLNQGNLTFTNFIGDFSGEAYDDDTYDRINWDDGIKQINVAVALEGPINVYGGVMETTLNSQDLIPNDQPYDVSPWNYSGSESVPNMPNTDIVDWVLLEYRDAPNAASATESTTIGRQAAFLLSTGTIVDIDGSSFLNFPYTLTDQLFVIVRHRNHLAVMSATSLTESSGIFTYNFSFTPDQAYGTNALKNLGGIYGMYSGDANADDMINNTDKNNYWNIQTGTQGYLAPDFSMDGQVNNIDKNEMWNLNQNTESQIP